MYTSQIWQGNVIADLAMSSTGTNMSFNLTEEDDFDSLYELTDIREGNQTSGFSPFNMLKANSRQTANGPKKKSRVKLAKLQKSRQIDQQFEGDEHGEDLATSNNMADNITANEDSNIENMRVVDESVKTPSSVNSRCADSNSLLSSPSTEDEENKEVLSPLSGTSAYHRIRSNDSISNLGSSPVSKFIVTMETTVKLDNSETVAAEFRLEQTVERSAAGVGSLMTTLGALESSANQKQGPRQVQRPQQNEDKHPRPSTSSGVLHTNIGFSGLLNSEDTQYAKTRHQLPRQRQLSPIKHAYSTMPSRSPGGKPRVAAIDLTNDHEPREIPESDQEIQILPQQSILHSTNVLGADDLSELEEVISARRVNKRKAAAIELKSDSLGLPSLKVSGREKRLAKERRDEGNGKEFITTTPVQPIAAADGTGVNNSSITVKSSSPEDLEVRSRTTAWRADEVVDSDIEEVHKSAERKRDKATERQYDYRDHFELGEALTGVSQNLESRYVERRWNLSTNGFEPKYTLGKLNAPMPSRKPPMKGRYSGKGGPQPVNYLQKNPSRDHAPKRKSPPHHKAYDLHNNTYNASNAPKSSDHHTDKRQRIGSHDQAMKRLEISDVELETTKDHGSIHDALISTSSKGYERRGSSAARSILSDDQHSNRSNIQSSPNAVGEYNSVENVVQPSQLSYKELKKSRQNGTGPRPPILAPKDKLLSKSRNTKQQEPIEIDDDISDSDSPVAQKKRKVGTENTQSASKTPYRGNANLRPSRRNNKHTITARRKTGTTSDYFTVSRASASQDELDTAIENDPPAKKLRKKQTSKRSPTGSVDDLAEGHLRHDFGKTKDMQHKDNAAIFLARAGIRPKLLAGDKADFLADTKGNKTNGLVDLDTDDETEKMKSDIKPSFLLQRSAKPATKDGICKVFINQVFPVQVKSLVSPSKDQWNLEYVIGNKSKKDGNLTFIDAQGQTVFEFRASSIRKIEYEMFSAKLIFHLHGGNDRQFGSPLLVEFVDPDHCADIRDSLKEMDPVLDLIDRTSTSGGDSYLDKAFKNPRNQKLLPKPQAESATEVAQDLQLMQSNSERRTEAANNSRRKAVHGQNEIATQASRASGRAKGMLSRAVETEANLRGQSSNAQTISPTDFYSGGAPSGSARRNLRSLPSTSETPATRSSKRASGKSFATRGRDRSSSLSPPQPELPRWSKENTQWTEKWNGSVIYPVGSKKQATVDQQDIQRLDEGEFLNDNIVNFYLRYLEHKLEQQKPDVFQRVYFHNSYFYPTLTKNGRKGIDYVAVQRWTRKAGIMDKDYIVVPVCENLHWYVAIICNFKKMIETKPSYEEEANPRRVKIEEDEAVANAETTPLKSSLLSSLTNPELLQGEDRDLGNKDSASIDENSPGSGVDKQIKELSLDDQQIEDGDSQSSWPSVEENPRPKHALDRGVGEADGKDVDEHPVANIKSDITRFDTPVKRAASQKQKQKKTSNGPIRDSTKPMIITLDSLDLAHSPTCVHLRDYLVAEIKDKLGKAITPPSHLGVRARNIPGQNNHCDCGVYLLSYVEKFLESPDEFVKGIVSKSRFVDWKPNASEKREQLRALLFELQREVAPQPTTSKQKRPVKAKQVEAKKVERSSRESSNGSPSKTLIREAPNAPPEPGIPTEDSPTIFTNIPSSTTEKRRRAKSSLSPARPSGVYNASAQATSNSGNPPATPNRIFAKAETLSSSSLHLYEHHEDNEESLQMGQSETHPFNLDTPERPRTQHNHVRHAQPKSPDSRDLPPHRSPEPRQTLPRSKTSSMDLGKPPPNHSSPGRSSPFTVELEEPDACQGDSGLVDNQLSATTEGINHAALPNDDDDAEMLLITNACTSNGVPSFQTRPRQRSMANYTREEAQAQSPDLLRMLEHKVGKVKEDHSDNDVVEINGLEQAEMETIARPTNSTCFRFPTSIGKHTKFEG